MHVISTSILLCYLIDITLQPPVEDGLKTYTKLSAYEELYITKVDSLEDINDCKPWSNLMENDTLCLKGTVDFSKALKDYSKAVHIKMVDSCNQTTFKDSVTCEEEISNNSECYCKSKKDDIYIFICYKRLGNKDNNAVIQAYVTNLQEETKRTNELHVKFNQKNSNTDVQSCPNLKTSEANWKELAIVFIIITILLFFLLLVILIHVWCYFIRKRRKRAIHTTEKGVEEKTGGDSYRVDAELLPLTDKQDSQKPSKPGKSLQSRSLLEKELREMPKSKSYTEPAKEVSACKIRNQEK
ncbi:hypothetical protein Bpfe_003529 [Biomphalaria pfeifferi]|uniref:Uncharacterized protein n=1 Tax=Biomphalaria pfeifferi TaxID=112525 RepID=A0AAD8C5F3_BIOPF|nr:hypothetical protein Bpfe_003529 [Biomphalaria pfeifferi]